jgi:hypothetical protein
MQINTCQSVAIGNYHMSLLELLATRTYHSFAYDTSYHFKENKSSHEIERNGLPSKKACTPDRFFLKVLTVCFGSRGSSSVVPETSSLDPETSSLDPETASSSSELGTAGSGINGVDTVIGFGGQTCHGVLMDWQFWQT